MTDWAARLDDRGYHILPAKRSNPVAKWDGETRSVPEGGKTWTEGDAIIIFDPENEQVQLRVEIGNAVYLNGGRKGKAAEIVRVNTIFSESDEDLFKKEGIWFYCTYYWRPEIMKTLADNEPWERKELFLQTTPESKQQSVAAIELIPVIIANTSTGFVDAPHRFFQQRTFHLATLSLSALPAAPAAGAPTADEAQPMDADSAPAAPPRATKGTATDGRAV